MYFFYFLLWIIHFFPCQVYEDGWTALTTPLACWFVWSACTHVQIYFGMSPLILTVLGLGFRV